MPLKHTTETFLIFLLAVAMIATGMVMQTLADLPNGLVPWSVLFVLGVAYPLALAHLFRRNRADYEFRMLHWVPAAMLLLWLLLQGGMSLFTGFMPVFDWYTWGWSLPAVATGFLLLIVFVIKVLRRWTMRLALLIVAFLPFMVGAVANEYYDWTPQMAAVLWQGEWWQLDTSGTGTQVAQTDKNLDASEDPAEERYRDRLRVMENRKDRIVQRMEDRMKDADAEDMSSEDKMMMGAHSSRPAEPPSIGSASSMPSQLPSSGFGWAAIMMFMMAAYCAVLHRKTILRVR